MELWRAGSRAALLGGAGFAEPVHLGVVLHDGLLAGFVEGFAVASVPACCGPGSARLGLAGWAAAEAVAALAEVLGSHNRRFHHVAHRAGNVVAVGPVRRRSAAGGAGARKNGVPRKKRGFRLPAPGGAAAFPDGDRGALAALAGLTRGSQLAVPQVGVGEVGERRDMVHGDAGVDAAEVADEVALLEPGAYLAVGLAAAPYRPHVAPCS